MAIALKLGVPQDVSLTTVVQRVSGARVARFIGLYSSDVDVKLVFEPVAEGAAVPASAVTVDQAIAQLFWHEVEGRGRFLGLAGSGVGTARVVVR